MDSHNRNLKDLAALLREHRPQPTPLQLEEVKRRVIHRHERPSASSRWTSWRYRLVLASFFVLAFAVNAFGVPGKSYFISSATQGGTGNNPANIQYCPKDNPNHPACRPRMTGGGSGVATFPAGIDVRHGFELRCDVNNPPNRLEVNWGVGNHFHLTSLTTVLCLDDPATAAPPPGTNWDTYYGTGTGRLNNGDTGTAEWCFQDGGEPGGGGVDRFTLKITDSAGNVVLFFVSSSNQGNHQAHGFTAAPSPGTCPAITASSSVQATTSKKKK